MTTWNSFGTVAVPFLLVTPGGPTDGGNYGPNTPGTVTAGIQEALNSLPSTGGTVFIASGSYSLSKGIVNTSSNQIVIFGGGVTLNFSSGATPITSSALGSVWIGIASSFVDSAKVNYSHNRWLGNGCTINLTNVGSANPVFGLIQYGQYDGFGGAAGEDFVVDGFNLPGMFIGTNAWYLGVNHYTTLASTGADLLFKIRNVRLSRIFASYASGTTTGRPEMNVCQGAWHDVEISDCSMDASGVNATDGGQLFVRANMGDSEQMVVRRCYFRGVGHGEVCELQGSGTGINESSQRVCQQIYIEDCTFDSNSNGILSTAIYVNDNNLGVSVGYIANVEFRRCAFFNCGLTLQSYGFYFGYLRFIDCYSPQTGGFPGTISGTLTGRYPLTSGNWASISFTNPYTNNDSIDELVSVSGGSVSSITLGGEPTGLTSGIFRLRPGDSIKITYTTAPALLKAGV